MSIVDIPQLQGLTAAEKLHLIEELWESLDESAKSGPISDSEKAILDARLAEYEANPSATVPLADFHRQWAARHPEWATGNEL